MFLIRLAWIQLVGLYMAQDVGDAFLKRLNVW